MIQNGQILHGIYEIRYPIGRGASGQVYLAWHLNLKKYVVVKRIRDDFVGQINERREADILKKLHHRFIPQVYDFIQEGQDVYTVIDYIDGNTMREFIQQNMRFDEAQIIKWLRQLLDALDYIHTKTPPVLHNDIKPSNIIISAEGDAYLIDFNISTDAYSENELGGYSRGFASPEQMYRMMKYTTGGDFRDVHLDARSDLFSLAASFYALMTGESPVSKIRQHQPLWDQDCPYSEPLRDLLTRALQQDPEKRIQSASLMIDELNSIKKRDHEFVHLRKRQFGFTLAMAAVIAFGVALAGFGYYRITEENYEEAYNEILDASESGDYAAVIEEAVNTLNDGHYTLYYTRNPESRSDLLYMIADAYFQQGEYDSSLDYYRDAIDAGTEETGCYRDYAIALVMCGDKEEVADVLQEAEQRGLSEADQLLVESEIEISDGNLESGIEKAQEVIRTAGSDDGLLFHAYSVLSDAYLKQDKYTEAIDTLEEAASELDGSYQNSVLRKLANACVLKVEKEDSDTDEATLQKAEEVLEKLTGSSDTATFEDYTNLVDVKTMLKKYDEAMELLQDLEKTWPDRYEIPVREGLIEISIQGGKSEDERDYTQALSYYNRAKELYESHTDRNEASSGQYEMLGQYIEDLKNAGWIEE